MTVAYIGLGSNIGARSVHIAQALGILRDRFGFTVLRTSRLYETQPVDVNEANPSKFLNGVAKVRVNNGLGVGSLLEALKETEAALGRTRGERNASRCIDLDILLYCEGDGIHQDVVRDVSVPHARMHQRRFVLQPLCDVVSDDAMHPIFNTTYKTLLEQLACDDEGAVVPVMPFPLGGGDREIVWKHGEMTRIMGILNCTPDSFSGDGVLRVQSMRRYVLHGNADGRGGYN